MAVWTAPAETNPPAVRAGVSPVVSSERQSGQEEPPEYAVLCL